MEQGSNNVGLLAVFSTAITWVKFTCNTELPRDSYFAHVEFSAHKVWMMSMLSGSRESLKGLAPR